MPVRFPEELELLLEELELLDDELDDELELLDDELLEEEVLDEELLEVEEELLELDDVLEDELPPPPQLAMARLRVVTEKICHAFRHALATPGFNICDSLG